MLTNIITFRTCSRKWKSLQSTSHNVSRVQYAGMKTMHVTNKTNVLHSYAVATPSAIHRKVFFCIFILIAKLDIIIAISNFGTLYFLVVILPIFR